MNNFKEIKGRLGFGCMRLPMNGEKVDNVEFSKMIDTYLENGFNYFDTAHGYLGGKSEIALRECLTARYPRESYVLTNKLSNDFFESEADIRPFFESQLEICGVDYFDFYLMHAQNEKSYEKYKRCRAYETAAALKTEGKIKYYGLSFHDKAAILDRILTEYPDIDVVQIQFNYADYEDASVEARKCYEVCVKHGKPVVVMEPVKGGALADKLPMQAKKVLSDLNGGSIASYAIRYVAGFDNVISVLSGMGNMEMMNDNIKSMTDFTPLNETELDAIDKVCGILTAQNLIQCTSCKYCTDGCPKNIAIPDLFACMNGKTAWKGWNADFYYGVHTQNGGKASDCISCGKCEDACPQHLPIRELLRDIAIAFEQDE